MTKPSTLRTGFILRDKLTFDQTLLFGSEITTHGLPNASDQQRPASGQTELLNKWAMWSGNIIDDLGEIKGVRCG